MPPPKAVLLDVGGIFMLPDRERILGAFSRALATPVPPVERVDPAHYVAAASFTVDLDAENDWDRCWRGYLDAYITACGVERLDSDEVHRHLDSEFADAALWSAVVPGCREGLRALEVTGVRLGVISNADGLVASRLADAEILQVGPGPGAKVECVIDSGAVGVMKPDPRIFRIGLEAMGLEAHEAWYVGDLPAIDVVGARRAGLRPLVLDPLGLHTDAGYDRVASLSELAERIHDD